MQSIWDALVQEYGNINYFFDFLEANRIQADIREGLRFVDLQPSSINNLIVNELRIEKPDNNIVCWSGIGYWVIGGETEGFFADCGGFMVGSEGEMVEFEPSEFSNEFA